MKISNTLTGQLEEFHPLVNNQVRMYTCGPTVYDYAHLGNFRTFIFEDVLKRYLRSKGYQIKHVMNVTDVDDKTIRNSGSTEPKKLREYTDIYTAAFFEDCDRLRIERPDLVVHATDHIPDMVALILRLQAKGYTYQKDGSTYFKIANFRDYGKLSKLDMDGIKVGARVDMDEYEKQDARDFVLWKVAKDGEPFWETPLGPGRPGWHVECSAMSMKYLGESFDLHCGAVDLIFPHHENEIAQSEAATEKPFVRYWMHGEHLVVDGEKMSKSKGNYYTLRDLLERGHDPLAVRYALLSVPYRRKLNFTFDLIRQSARSLERLRDLRLRLNPQSLKDGRNKKVQALSSEARLRFEGAMDDDLNTAQALGAIFDFVREINVKLSAGELGDEDRQVVEQTMQKFDAVLGVFDKLESAITSEVLNLIEERTQAKRVRNFALADQLRNRVFEMGYIIEDTREGVRWKKRSS